MAIKNMAASVFLIKNLHGSLENIKQTMRDICNISTGNDFITIKVLGDGNYLSR